MTNSVSSKKLISVLILTYEGESIIEKCVQSVLKQKLNQFDVEIIVLDNGSTDNSFNILKSMENIKLLQNHVNNSFTKGFNKLFNESSGDFILILSNDVFLRDDKFLEKAASFLMTNDEYVAFAPKSIKTDGSIERIPKREIDIYRLFIDYTLLGPIIRIFFPRISIGSPDYDLNTSIADVEVLQDSSLLVRRSAFINNKIFDESMSFYYTEDYLCDLLRNNGSKLFYSADIEVEHLYRFSTSKMGKIRISWIYAKDAIFFSANKYGKIISYFFLAPLTAITLLFRIFIWFIKGELSWKD